MNKLKIIGYIITNLFFFGFEFIAWHIKVVPSDRFMRESLFFYVSFAFIHFLIWGVFWGMELITNSDRDKKLNPAKRNYSKEKTSISVSVVVRDSGRL